MWNLMSGSKYLEDLIASQEMKEGCDELVALDKERDEVELLLNTKYPYSNLTFTHGGSRAKGTMIREDYDLDEVVYFENEDTAAGETLEEIYEDVAKLLEESYSVRRKRSALRLRSADGKKDLKVDVVPGRYIDGTKTDVFLHQNEGDKERLKTNLVVHIQHIRDSGCTDVIKLAKLWRTRNGIKMKTFPLELLVIEVLDGNNGGDLEERFKRVLEEFRDNMDNLSIEDPANPTGNDLSLCLTDGLRDQLATTAGDTLETVENDGWEAVFGKIETKSASRPRVEVLRSAAASVQVATRPWSSDE
jgi:hypothetical protein